MKALALISGGLDSALAAKLMQNQGTEVVGLYFQIPFCNYKKEMLADLGIEIKCIDIKKEFLEVLKNPRYGFGANMNPCIDCKIFMLSKTKELMSELKAKFVITGEVLGQRPMSQHRQALEIIEKESGLAGLILRPLSAKLLLETIPEKQGWVRRQELFDFSGRTRKPQMALAEKLNIKKYPNPSGGCLLTDPEFAKRLKELITQQELSTDNIELLKIGRHFRLAPNTKLVVGRNEKENEELFNKALEGDYLFFPTDELAGPTSLGRGKFSDDLIKLSCQITCRYCDLNGAANTGIVYKKVFQPEEKVLKVSVIEEKQLITLRI